MEDKDPVPKYKIGDTIIGSNGRLYAVVKCVEPKKRNSCYCCCFDGGNEYNGNCYMYKRKVIKDFTETNECIDVIPRSAIFRDITGGV